MQNKLILPSTPKIDKLYSEILRYINTIVTGLPFLQRLDHQKSKGTNGQFTLTLLLVIVLTNVLVIDTYYISLIVGFYYPVIRTIRTIKSTAIVDYHRWATYWLIFVSTGIIFKGLIDMILGYLPYYQLWRMGFYVTLYHPKLDYAYKFYLQILKPFFKKMRKQQKSTLKQNSSDNKQQKQIKQPQILVNQIIIDKERRFSDMSAKST